MPSKINTALHGAQLVEEFDIKGMVAGLQLDETVVPVAIIADLQRPQVRGGVFQGFRRQSPVAGERSIVGFTSPTTSARQIPSPRIKILQAYVRSELAGNVSVLITSNIVAINGPGSSPGRAIDPPRLNPQGTGLLRSGSVLTSGTRALAHTGTVISRDRPVDADTWTRLTEMEGIELAQARTGSFTPGLVVQVDANNNTVDLVVRWEELPPGD